MTRVYEIQYLRLIEERSAEHLPIYLKVFNMAKYTHEYETAEKRHTY